MTCILILLMTLLVVQNLFWQTAGFWEWEREKFIAGKLNFLAEYFCCCDLLKIHLKVLLEYLMMKW